MVNEHNFILNQFSVSIQQAGREMLDRSKSQSDHTVKVDQKTFSSDQATIGVSSPVLID